MAPARVERRGSTDATPPKVPPLTLRHVAVHEAGHVVVAHLMGYGVKSVEVYRCDLGYWGASFITSWLKDERHAGYLMMLLAGSVAEVVILGVAPGFVTEGDFARYRELSRYTEASRSKRLAFWQHYDATAALIERNREKVERIARVISRQKKLDERQIARLLAHE